VKIKSYLLVLFLLVVCSPSWAHYVPVYPASVELKVYPQWIRAVIKTNPDYWKEEILEIYKLPVRNWPSNIREKAEKYLNDHFVLSLDGTPLPAQWRELRVVENPWEVNSGGHLQFEAVYPFPFLPRPDSLLSIHSTLYLESFEELKHSSLSREVLEQMRRNYEVRVSIVGKTCRGIVFTPEVKTFEVPFAEVLRTRRQIDAEHVIAGMEWFFIHFAFVLFFTVVLLARLQEKEVWNWYSLLSCFLIPILMKTHVSWIALQKIDFLLVVGICALSYWTFPPWTQAWWIGVSGLVGGFELIRAAESLNLPKGRSVVAYMLFALGWSLACGIWLAAVGSVLYLHRQRLLKIYTSVGNRVFLSHVRFLVQAIAMVAAYFLIQEWISSS